MFYLRKTAILAIAFILVLAACSPSVQPTEAPQPTSAGGDSSQAYPYPASSDTYVPPTAQSYPGPTQEAAANPNAGPVVVPEPGTDTGVVTGQVIDANTGDPLAFFTVYLGIKIYMTPGPGYTYGLQERSSPHVVTNEEGYFAMDNVPPGSYILMVFHPERATVVMKPNSDQELDIVVTAGKVLDIGKVDGVSPFTTQ